MKKFLIILFVVFMLFGCGTTAKVEKELQGNWEFSLDTGDVRVDYSFTNGECAASIYLMGDSMDVSKGKYEVTEDAILIMNEYMIGDSGSLEKVVDEEVITFPYTYENGNLVIYSADRSMILKKK